VGVEGGRVLGGEGEGEEERQKCVSHRFVTSPDSTIKGALVQTKSEAAPRVFCQRPVKEDGISG
ncbi:MAG TPA: hypothetical protein PLF84_09210, partial [Bryobacteraceae bacterium]|nr:hypothetical protein [Bryobacteraceae bacterium]